MRIPLSFAMILQRLYHGEKITGSEISVSGKKILSQFVKDGVIEESFTGTTRKLYACLQADSLTHYLHHKFEIPSLTEYILYLEDNHRKRSDAIHATSDSKFKRERIFEGFLVNTLHPVKIKSGGEERIIHPEKSLFTFVHDISTFVIPADTMVVGVEGFENFKNLQQQDLPFVKDRSAIFVWRYQNSIAIANWLTTNNNEYMHLGDFDPKGLHIYVSEFRQKIGSARCSFFIPENLEDLIKKHGNKKLYETQCERLQRFDPNQFPEIIPVWNLIKKYSKGLEQEILIKSK